MAMQLVFKCKKCGIHFDDKKHYEIHKMCAQARKIESISVWHSYAVEVLIILSNQLSEYLLSAPILFSYYMSNLQYLQEGL